MKPVSPRLWGMPLFRIQLEQLRTLLPQLLLSAHHLAMTTLAALQAGEAVLTTANAPMYTIVPAGRLGLSPQVLKASRQLRRGLDEEHTRAQLLPQHSCCRCRNTYNGAAPASRTATTHNWTEAYLEIILLNWNTPLTINLPTWAVSHAWKPE